MRLEKILGIIAAALCFSISAEAKDTSSAEVRQMVRTIREACRVVTSKHLLAPEVAKRLGTEISDNGGTGQVDFTPRDPNFKSGTAPRQVRTGIADQVSF